MLEKTINIWDIPDEDGVKAITTNGIRYFGGSEGLWYLVMGAGIALQAAKKYPILQYDLAVLVEKFGNLPFYLPDLNLMSFPTKEHWRDPSPLWLIERSALLMLSHMEEFEIEHIFLPRPGCSLGGLDWETEVKPLLDPILPDTVTIVDVPNGAGLR